MHRHSWIQDFYLILLVLYLLSGASCKERTKPQLSRQSEESKRGEVRPQSEGIPMTPKKSEEKRPAPSSRPPEQPGISMDPLFGIPVQRVPAEDFRLGPLLPPDSSEEEGVRIAELFFARIQKGTSVEDLLHPEYRWFLEEDLKPPKGKTIPVWKIRYGPTTKSQEGGLEIPFRVLTEKSRAQGTLLLEKTNDNWYIVEIFLDWNALFLQNEAIVPEKFDPFAANFPKKP